MANLPITLELIQDALSNFEGRPVTADLIREVSAEVDRLRTVEGQAPDAPEGPGSVNDVFGDAEKEAAPPADAPPDPNAPPPAPDAGANPPAEVRVVKPREKMQKLVILYDPETKIARNLEFLAYIIEIPEGEPPDGRTFNNRLLDAVTSHNESKKGRQHPAETMRDALEKIPYDYLRYYKIRILTEAPVFVLLRGAELPVAPPPPAEPAP